MEETQFSVDRGFYTQPFSLVISTATSGATIRYSLNGATPADADNTKSVTSISRSGSTATATIANHGYANGDWVLIRGATAPEYNGVFVISGVTANTFDYTVAGTPATPATGTITAQANYYTYTGPITINRTTTVRAAAFKTAYAATDVDTQTYVFLDDILVQPAVPPGLPATWNGTPADYQMDPDIVNDPAYRDTLKDALQSLPTMSIVTDQANLFDPATGIYANPLVEGWERPVSLEYFDPAGSGRVPGQRGLAHLRRRGTLSRVQEALAAGRVQGASTGRASWTSRSSAIRPPTSSTRSFSARTSTTAGRGEARRRSSSATSSPTRRCWP